MRFPSILYGAAILSFIVTPCRAFCQGDDLFNQLHVDVSIVVYKHSTGADMVTVTVLDPDYPTAELEARASEIGTGLGTPVRGLKLEHETNGAQASDSKPFLKASFATNGILGGEAGIRLEPIVRAFAGGSGRSLVQGMDIHFEGALATPSTLYSYTSNAVQVQGKPEPSPAALVYRVRLKTQDPKLISIPDRMGQPESLAPAPPAPSSPSSGVIWVLVIVGSLAAFALVYNLALRASSRTHRG